jgi:hypothetical protein
MRRPRPPVRTRARRPATTSCRRRGHGFCGAVQPPHYRWQSHHLVATNFRVPRAACVRPLARPWQGCTNVTAARRVATIAACASCVRMTFQESRRYARLARARAHAHAAMCCCDRAKKRARVLGTFFPPPAPSAGANARQAAAYPVARRRRPSRRASARARALLRRRYPSQLASTLSARCHAWCSRSLRERQRAVESGSARSRAARLHGGAGSLFHGACGALGVARGAAGHGRVCERIQRRGRGAARRRWPCLWICLRRLRAQAGLAA